MHESMAVVVFAFRNSILHRGRKETLSPRFSVPVFLHRLRKLAASIGFRSAIGKESLRITLLILDASMKLKMRIAHRFRVYRYARRLLRRAGRGNGTRKTRAQDFRTTMLRQKTRPGEKSPRPKSHLPIRCREIRKPSIWASGCSSRGASSATAQRPTANRAFGKYAGDLTKFWRGYREFVNIVKKAARESRCPPGRI